MLLQTAHTLVGRDILTDGRSFVASERIALLLVFPVEQAVRFSGLLNHLTNAIHLTLTSKRRGMGTTKYFGSYYHGRILSAKDPDI